MSKHCAHVDATKKHPQRGHGAAHPAFENEIVQHSIFVQYISIDIFELLHCMQPATEVAVRCTAWSDHGGIATTRSFKQDELERSFLHCSNPTMMLPMRKALVIPLITSQPELPHLFFQGANKPRSSASNDFCTNQMRHKQIRVNANEITARTGGGIPRIDRVLQQRLYDHQVLCLNIHERIKNELACHFQHSLRRW